MSLIFLACGMHSTYSLLVLLHALLLLLFYSHATYFSGRWAEQGQLYILGSLVYDRKKQQLHLKRNVKKEISIFLKKIEFLFSSNFQTFNKINASI